MATDPNWLMSTAAQSAAALVAIIGGFLVSRVIALTGDRRTAELRHAEARHRIALLNRRLTSAKTKLAEWDAAQLYDEMREHILERRGRVGALDLLAQGTVPRRDASAVLQILQPLFDATARAFDVLEPLFARGVPSNELVQEAIAQHGRRRIMRTALQDVYRHLKEEQQRQELEEDERMEEARRTRHSSLGASIPEFRLPEMPVIESQAEQLARGARRQQLLEAVEQIENDLSDQQAEESLAARIAESAMTSKGIWEGFVVLSVFAVTGVVIPVWTIALQPPSLSLLHRGVLVALFLVGLVLLMGYLVIIIVRLRQSEPLLPTDSTSESAETDNESTA